MPHLLRTITVTALTLIAPLALGQYLTEVPRTADYARLLKATKFVENYREMAAVSARVFGARGQGSDKEYARAMAVVSTADLSDTEGCLVGVYRSQSLTKQDITALVSVFESPLGIKLVQISQRKLVTDLERGSVQPFPAGAFTEEEKRQIVALQQNASFRKYSLISANPAFAASVARCIIESKALKNAGISVDGK
jgi:hypothetical protein